MNKYFEEWITMNVAVELSGMSSTTIKNEIAKRTLRTDRPLLKYGQKLPVFINKKDVVNRFKLSID